MDILSKTNDDLHTDNYINENKDSFGIPELSIQSTKEDDPPIFMYYVNNLHVSILVDEKNEITSNVVPERRSKPMTTTKKTI